MNLRYSHFEPCLVKALMYTCIDMCIPLLCDASASLLSGTPSYGPQEPMASFSDVALTQPLFNGANP